jgi:hypothetical protein
MQRHSIPAKPGTATRHEPAQPHAQASPVPQFSASPPFLCNTSGSPPAQVRLICPWDEEVEEAGLEHAPPADLNQLYQGQQEEGLVDTHVRAAAARLHSPDMRVGLGGQR